MTDAPKQATILTNTGRLFDYLGEDPNEVSILDIATGLSRIPRYVGQTLEAYSVAQHSCIVSQLMEDAGEDEDHQLLGLLHDAPEAYCCDIPRPLKQLLPDYQKIEQRVWEKVATHFFGSATLFDLEDVKPYDMRAFTIEKACLFPHVENGTSYFEEPIDETDLSEDEFVEDEEGNPITGRAIKIYPVCHHEAYHMFIDRYLELRG